MNEIRIGETKSDTTSCPQVAESVNQQNASRVRLLLGSSGGEKNCWKESAMPRIYGFVLSFWWIGYQRDECNASVLSIEGWTVGEGDMKKPMESNMLQGIKDVGNHRTAPSIANLQRVMIHLFQIIVECSIHKRNRHRRVSTNPTSISLSWLLS